MADAAQQQDVAPPTSATPRQRLEEARIAAAAVDPSAAAVSARARTSSLPDAETKTWPAMCRRVVTADGADLPPVLASVHGCPDDPHVFRLEAIGFAGERHVVMVTVSDTAIPADPALRPAFAARILDSLIVSAASGSAGASLPETQLSLKADLDATWLAS